MSVRSPYNCFDTFSKLSKIERFEAIKLLVKSLDFGEVESFIGSLDYHLEKTTVQRSAEVIDNDDCQDTSKAVVNVHKSNDSKPRHKRKSYSKNGVSQEKDDLKHCTRIKGNCIVKPSEKMLFSCGKCGKSFSSVNSHSMHIKEYICKEVPDKQFRGESKLKKPHTCPKCFRTFSRTGLVSHKKRFHDGEKPFVCDICHKSWAVKIDLVLHRRIHSGEKPHSCHFCQRKFSRSSSLMNHKKVHTQLKSSCTCENCGKVFMEKTSLKYHMNTAHLNNNDSFSCISCEKSFFHARSLKRHNMLHSGEKPYTCELCGKAFIQKSNMKYHMKTNHIEAK